MRGDPVIRIPDADFRRQIQGYGLSTVEVSYYMPDHPALLQLFVVSRLIKYLGVQAGVLVLPVLAFAGYAILAFAPVLALVEGPDGHEAVVVRQFRAALGDKALAKLQRDTYGYFLKETNPENGLVPDNTRGGAPCRGRRSGSATTPTSGSCPS